MERVIALLREKNLFLEKFYVVNEQELLNFVEGNFEMVEPFYQARDKILDLINCIDGLLHEENLKEIEPATEAQKSEAHSLMNVKDELVKSILAQDLQIMTYIEKEKSNIIRELRSNGIAKKAVGAYANTERINQLDEKP
jgi:hypothetical protein